MPATRSRPKPTLALLVRHGQTPTTGKLLPGRSPGLHLADEGQRQAENAAKRIAALPRIGAVYASSLERARETAAPIARERGCAVRVDRDLADLDPGDWTGQSLDKLSKKPEWNAVQRHPSGFRFPGGESFMEMQARVVSAVERIVERHRGETVVVVSHADPIKALVAHALGVHLDLFQRIAIATGSITAVAYWPAGTMVLTVNSIDGDLGWLQKR
ncbi:MAG: phosphoglycerate mutase [Candidatus Rokuibacteriota bacterium]|nr:MAG: phosphoglycerate mutase [Candidatus Rokubacteria bacterium]